MKILKKISIHLFILSIFIIPVLLYAQATPTTPIHIGISNPLKCDSGSGQDCNSLSGLITAILNNVVMPIAAVAVVIWIIWAGFTFITAQGKPAEIEKAKGRLLWSLIGAGILLGAAGISAVIQNTIGALIKIP
ncbi:MAG: hypothetical protein NTX96_01040 [Candidatus Zambryskibacteria bacterium]|nr:hypothetical protein [Candidatus Zambryskibacteria bacterium]